MTLLRLILIAVLSHMVFVSARMTASLYALANEASTFTVGVILALFSLVPMLISVRAGRWVDAIGPRRPTLIGALLILGGALLPSAFSYAAADLAPVLVAASLIVLDSLGYDLVTQCKRSKLNPYLETETVK